ncbi:MAG: sugar transporter, partial [Pseudomonadota bacterium]
GSAEAREFGAVTAWHLDARNAANFALMTRFELRPDDVIFVAQQPITRWNRAVSQLLPSLISTARIAADNG